MTEPRNIRIEDPGPFLEWVTSPPGDRTFHLQNVDFIQVWALVALAALGREEESHPILIDTGDATVPTVRFAHALGMDEVVRGAMASGPTEVDRTVKIARIAAHREIDPLAKRFARLAIPDPNAEDSRLTVQYVLVELFRNALQHSGDPRGGVAAAQVNDKGLDRDRPTVQVAVADTGIGIFEALSRQHRDVKTPGEALEKALWPHVSGAFESGYTGSENNAGMGLFFISEMAKLTAGRLVVATRDATLALKGDFEGLGKHDMQLLPGVGFPGTLVVFEIPVREVLDYDALIEAIRERAQERTPARVVEGWLRFEEPPDDCQRFIVSVAAEDTTKAEQYGNDFLIPRIVKGECIALDFRGYRICTQSFIHALLFAPLRVAWATRSPIYIVNAAPAVRSTLQLLEGYALAG